jgi:hypothetical protein
MPPAPSKKSCGILRESVGWLNTSRHDNASILTLVVRGHLVGVFGGAVVPFSKGCSPEQATEVAAGTSVAGRGLDRKHGVLARSPSCAVPATAWATLVRLCEKSRLVGVFGGAAVVFSPARGQEATPLLDDPWAVLLRSGSVRFGVTPRFRLVVVDVTLYQPCAFPAARPKWPWHQLIRTNSAAS